MRSISSFFLALVVLSACHPKELSEEKLLSYIANPENGLRQTVAHDDIQFEIYYKPSTLMMADEILDAQNEKDREAIKATYDSLDYFIMRMSIDGHEVENSFAADEQRFEQLIRYLSYSVREQFSMIVDSDTIAPLDVVYSRAFGTADATSLVVVFRSNLKEGNGAVSIVFNDEWFKTGQNRFTFDSEDIKNTPALKLTGQ